MSSMSRREFLVSAALAAAGAAGAGTLRAQPLWNGQPVPHAVVPEQGLHLGYEFGLASPADKKDGFAVLGAVAVNPLKDRIGRGPAKPGPEPAAYVDSSGHLIQDTFGLKFVCKSSRAQGNVVEQVWADTTGHVRVYTDIHQAPGQELVFHSRVENGWAFDLKSITFRMPTITAPAPEQTRVLDAFGGGRERDWNWGDGVCNDGLGYFRSSSLVVYYDQRSTAGVCVEYFDDRLRNFELHWNVSGKECRPWLDCNCFVLDKGCAADFGFRMKKYAQGLPDMALDAYRTQRLMPLMARYGIPEGRLETTGPWTSSGWPLDGNIVKAVARAKALGSHGYIQWAAPDGEGDYEPFPERFEWFAGVKKASKLGIPLGVLIDPNESPRLDQRAKHWALDRRYLPNHVAPMAYGAASAEAYLLKMRDNLVANGVSMAFWDTGGLPYKHATVEQYLNLLYQWKRGGITILQEAVRDHAAFITGTTYAGILNVFELRGALLKAKEAVYGGPLFSLAHPPRYQVWRRVTPKAKLFISGDIPNTTHQGNTYWWDVVGGGGFGIPLIRASVFDVWAKHHRS
jgi:hypothetical protein